MPLFGEGLPLPCEGVPLSGKGLPLPCEGVPFFGEEALFSRNALSTCEGALSSCVGLSPCDRTPLLRDIISAASVRIIGQEIS
jgi:hypothetical protein